MLGFKMLGGNGDGHMDDAVKLPAASNPSGDMPSLQRRVAEMAEIFVMPDHLSDAVDRARECRRARQREFDAAQAAYSEVFRQHGKASGYDQPPIVQASLAKLQTAEKSFVKAQARSRETVDARDTKFREITSQHMERAVPVLTELVDLLTPAVEALVDWHTHCWRNNLPPTPALMLVPQIQEGLRALRAITNGAR